MNLSSLKPAKGSNKPDGKRVGHGEGSGKAGTAGRGHKGAKSRSGYKSRKGFEGGQMPLQRTSPKFGFKNRNRKEFKPVNLDRIQEVAENQKTENIDVKLLVEKGIVNKNNMVKILGDGELKSKVTVKAHAFSKSAVEKIEAQGGTIEKI